MRRAVYDLIAYITLLGSLVISAGVVTAVVGLLGSWPWYFWVMASPLLYLVWLTVFLLISASICRQMGRRHPKPRHAILLPGPWHQSKDIFGFLTAAACYRRLAILDTVPFVSLLSQFRHFDTLVLRAYAPSVHIGRRVMNMARLYDPDLTEIGDNAVLGGKSAIVAHSMAVRTDGAIVYVSAPVRIGARATIGGEVRVALGCVIGEDAIVEMGSLVEPFTHIPRGEVWGGNPACFRRKREDLATDEHAAIGAAPVHTPSSPSAIPPALPHSGAPAAVSSSESIRQLVIEALGLEPGEAPEELSSETCPAWDSLGQVAIAAAIYDRHGITVDATALFRLRTLSDVAQVVAGRVVATPDVADTNPNQGPAPLTVSTTAVTNVAQRLLPEDVEMWPLMSSLEVGRALAVRREHPSGTAQPVVVQVAASFTAQSIGPSLKAWARAFGLEVECRFADYDQIVQTLVGSAERFASERDAVTVVLMRPEDLAADAAEAAAQLDQIGGAIQYTAETTPGRLIVGTLPPVVSSFDVRDRRASDNLRHQFTARLAGIAGIEVFDFAAVVERLGIEQARDNQSEVVTRGPYSPRLYQELAIALVRRLRARYRIAAKVLALDCDNTLWGGVVGEVGLDGLDLGPDGRGRSFQLFQRYIQHLKERGVLLVVVSKNEERDVRDVFEHHSGMVLKTSDIAAWRVNWAPKSQNLRELANELNLALNSFVLVDDDPVARMEVEARAPDVHVVPLPSEPAEYCETLARLWLFDGALTTAVDAVRTEMAHEEQQRQQARQSIPTLDMFLARLELRVEMRLASERDWQRIAQLSQRTNQFNLSLKRRTVDELKRLGHEAIVLVLEAVDRFGDYGLIGTAVLMPPSDGREPEVDTLLMSCRALGRGVEDAFLHGIAAVAAGTGATRLVARFAEGPRNGQVEAFLARTGFEEQPQHVWIRALGELPPLPSYIRFTQSTDAVFTRTR